MWNGLYCFKLGRHFVEMAAVRLLYFKRCKILVCTIMACFIGERKHVA
jgi:hypothetical protein